MAYFRPRDDEGVDRIELKVVDRFKTSELSGDEWRYSVAIQFFRKNKLVYEKRYSKMEWAVAALPYELMVLPEKVDIPLWGLDDKVCNQYGCSEPVAVVYKLKEQYTQQGEGPLPNALLAYRAYCKKHADRGDADREDNMKNYEIV